MTTSMSIDSREFGPLSRAVLAALWQLERTTSIDELAAHLRIEPAALAPVLQEMEARGLVSLDPDTDEVARLPHPRNPAT
jgi:DNA-binding MarR family transcriptional regulator